MPTITEINPQVGDVIEFRDNFTRITYTMDETGLKSERDVYLDQSYFDGDNKGCDDFHVVSRANQIEEKQMKHTYKTGDWVEALNSGVGLTKGKKYQITSIDESCAPLDFIDDDGDKSCFYLEEVKPAVNPTTIQVGESYTTKGRGEWSCIAESGDTVWMVQDYGNGPEGTAYTWTKGGKAISLAISPDEYDVDWGPVIKEGVRLDEGFTCVNDHYIYFEDHSVSVTTIDGEPDWTTLVVETKGGSEAAED